jgi:hypothetical protein
LSLRVEDAMRVSGLQRPELIIACATLVRNGLATSPVDAINKFADGSITTDMLEDKLFDVDEEI